MRRSKRTRSPNAWLGDTEKSSSTTTATAARQHKSQKAAPVSSTTESSNNAVVKRGEVIVEKLVQMPLQNFLQQYHDKKHFLLKRQVPTFYKHDGMDTGGVSSECEDPSSGSSPVKKDQGISSAAANDGVEIAWSTAKMKEAVERGLPPLESSGGSGGDDSSLANRPLYYGTDINIVRVNTETRKRVPLKTGGSVTSSELMEAMNSGWSVRFLRPHEHSSSLSRLIYLFEAAMGCSCGANSYWTPAGSQGFAPHYDDVDVFLLQLEGCKRWRLYKSGSDEDTLARFSSNDYDPKELPPPMADFTLAPGDLLYMPRGTIHQGVTPKECHSLHITLSACQMHSYADLIKVIMSRHVECVARNSINLRKSLPKKWLNGVGAINNNKIRYEELELPPLEGEQAIDRKEMLGQIRQCISEVVATSGTDGVKGAESIDLACDAFAQEMISRKQPPSSSSTTTTAGGQGEGGTTQTDRIKVLDPTSVRMILKDNEVEIVHCGHNSTVCMAKPVTKLRLERLFAPAIATLLVSGCGQTGVSIASLPFPDLEVEEDIQENRSLLCQSLVQSTSGFFAYC